MALSNRYLTIERVDKKGDSPYRWLSRLWTVFFLNWFLSIGLGCWWGGTAIGIMPSHDGFVLSNRTPLQGGGHTVSERAWLFSLFYHGATFFLTPLAVIIANVRQPQRTSLAAGKSRKNWLTLAIVTTFCIVWYGTVGPVFYRSVKDWSHYHPCTEILERPTPQPTHNP